jgi:hypothetical protein
MLYQEIAIPKYRWRLFVFYDTTKQDADDVMDCLYDLGCNGKTAKRAYLNLHSDQLDTGLTFSNKRKTCIVLGRASDKANFAHTFTHEITHCSIHIANEYGINPNSEALAYIAGDLGSVMLPYASKFLCDCCKKVYDGKR